MRKSTSLGVAWMLLAGSAGLAAPGPSDWPQFRGADQDGISKETAWNPRALEGTATELWKADVGAGYSGVSVVGDRAFTAGNQNNQDTVYALSLKSGTVLWHHSYPCAGGGYPGPRATPASDGVNVFMFSREGAVVCLDAASGAVKWRKDVMHEFGARNLKWGFSSSPILAGDKVLLNAGEFGIALSRSTGNKVWASPGGTGGYASPVVFSSAAGRMVAVFGESALYTVDLATGRKIGDVKWETSYDVNAADPIAHEGRLFITSGYGHGCALVDARSRNLSTVWESKSLRGHFSSCVLIDGFLYGFDGNAGNGSLKCLEWETGAVKWEERTGFGSLTAASGNLIVLTEKGDLLVIKADPAHCQTLATARQVLEKTCWTAPVLAHGILFCRNDKGRLVALKAGP